MKEEGGNMELRVLKYFLMAAREENITKAAQLLHVTQPTLSRQLMQLEKELNVKLFERSRQRIILTEDGMLLKRRAQEIITLAEKTEREFVRREGELIGEISIGSGELKGSRFIAEAVAAFREKHPLVQFRIYSGDSDNIKEQIERGLLDFGLLMEPVDIGKYEFIRIPVQEEWGILVHESSPLARKESIRPEDIVHVPLLLGQRDLVHQRVRNWFGSLSEEMNVAASGNLQYNMAMLVRSQAGIAVTIRLDCEYDEVRFIPLAPPLYNNTMLVWKKVQPFSPAATAFVEFFERYVKNYRREEKVERKD